MADNDDLTMDDLTLSDPGEDMPIDDDISFLDSPAPASRSHARNQPASRPPTSSRPPVSHTPPLEDPPDPLAREDQLRKELATLKTLNGHLSTMLTSLEAAQGSMGTINSTVAQSSTLLNTWTRILSQTEHNQRLILNPGWQGASTDAAEIAADEARREAERQRRKEADERRKADRERKLEEERLKREAASTGAGSARGGVRSRVSTTAGRGGVTGVRGTRGGVRGGSATASGRGVQRSTSVGARGRGTASTRAGRGRGV